MNKAGFNPVKMWSCCWKEGNVPEIWVGLLNNQKAITNRQKTNDLLDTSLLDPIPYNAMQGNHCSSNAEGKVKTKFWAEKQAINWWIFSKISSILETCRTPNYFKSGTQHNKEEINQYHRNRKQTHTRNQDSAFQLKNNEAVRVTLQRQVLLWNKTPDKKLLNNTKSRLKKK